MDRDHRQGAIRFLVSGMGDALSTVFEARANALVTTATTQ
jgi:glycerol dehydrogenase-like iron-containing ADH family enzyme